MSQEKPGQTLQATALVHEAWLKIAGDGHQHFANRESRIAMSVPSEELLAVNDAGA